jgi:uncharacterized membrane protein YphA (DoxX/SURF4 family)
MLNFILDYLICIFWTIKIGQLLHNFIPVNRKDMQLIKNYALPSVALRGALATSYLWEVADRLGFFGAHGQPHVGWGDWQHFMDYARQVMNFLPSGIIPTLAVTATIGEAGVGLLLLAGLFTRTAASLSCLLSLAFALAMAISGGIESPVGYSVFTVSAASLLLATLPDYKWSIDSIINKN